MIQGITSKVSGLRKGTLIAFLLIGIIILQSCLLLYLRQRNNEDYLFSEKLLKLGDEDEPTEANTRMQPSLPPINLLKTSKFYRDATALNCEPGHNKENKLLKSHFQEFFKDETIIERTRNCDNYFNEIPVLNLLDDDQKFSNEFPLAFSHLLNHEIGVFEAFLAVNFRPSDRHCIYIDKKAESKVTDAVQGLVKCYHEKFFSDLSVEERNRKLFVYDWTNPVIWGHISVLEGDLACLRQLLSEDQNNPNPWKYYFNLAGSELPLKSEKWTRKMLKNLDGKSITEGNPIPPNNHNREVETHFIHWFDYNK